LELNFSLWDVELGKNGPLDIYNYSFSNFNCIFHLFTYNNEPLAIKEYGNQGVLELGMYKKMTSFTKNDINVVFLNG